MRQTRTDYLQALWDAASDLMFADVVFRPFRGWYVESRMGQRYFGDDGEFLGNNWRDAEATIRWLTREVV